MRGDRSATTLPASMGLLWISTEPMVSEFLYEYQIQKLLRVKIKKG